MFTTYYLPKQGQKITLETLFQKLEEFNKNVDQQKGWWFAKSELKVGRLNNTQAIPKVGETFQVIVFNRKENEKTFITLKRQSYKVFEVVDVI